MARRRLVRPAPITLATALLAAAACTRPTPDPEPKPSTPPPAAAVPAAPAPDPIERADEPRLRNVRKLTSGGENAEAYWSTDGSQLVFQRRAGERSCDAIHVMRSDGSQQRMVADQGAHTCGYFLRTGPGAPERILFSSTMSAGPDCPPPPDRSKGYAWGIHESYDIYSSLLDGTDVRRLTDAPGYDAEGTVGPDGRIVFTSVRDGDLDLYVMQPDGSGVTRLTTTLGYDGGAFFSPDGSRIVYRAQHPEPGAEADAYLALLREGLVRPGRLEIWIMDSDGSNQRQVTSLGAAAFAPSFLPDGRRIIFASNHEDPKGRDFDLHVVGIDGSGLERVTTYDSFDGFPLFSPDGRRLAFCSNRGGAPGETNVFVADWVE